MHLTVTLSDLDPCTGYNVASLVCIPYHVDNGKQLIFADFDFERTHDYTSAIGKLAVNHPQQ